MLSLVLLVLLLPLLVGIAFLVRLSSPGPSLFRQTRVGLAGKDFLMLKFRTMTERPDSAAGSFDAGDDSRVTGIGKTLRATKLDELPQLWNVLKGEMSLVGPRPEVRKWVNAYSDRWQYIHQVKPGITDPASILFRNEEELLVGAEDPEELYRLEILPRKLDLYDRYVREQSLWLDMKIMAQTFLTVVSGRSGSW
jgi:lipopolysaccharide/colanic/teichoic acid biosynthesis glycosyltransferase